MQRTRRDSSALRNDWTSATRLEAAVMSTLSHIGDAPVDSAGRTIALLERRVGFDRPAQGDTGQPCPVARRQTVGRTQRHDVLWANHITCPQPSRRVEATTTRFE